MRFGELGMLRYQQRRYLIAPWLIAAALFASANAQETNKGKLEPLIIQEQGSFAVGGSVSTAPGTFDPIKQGAYNPAGTDPAGQTLHGDHAYVFYQVPVNARKLPLVFWHGHEQSAKTWETTPDGREGFQNIFRRRRFPVYLIDQPRRGRAARSRSTSLPHPINNSGSASSGSVHGRTFTQAYSSRATRKRSTSFSGGWCPTPAHTTCR